MTPVASRTEKSTDRSPRKEDRSVLHIARYGQAGQFFVAFWQASIFIGYHFEVPRRGFDGGFLQT